MFLCSQLLEANGLSATVNILEKSPHELTAADFGGRPVDAVVAEPHFSTSLLPWHNLHFWYACSALQGLLSPDCVFFPNRASLKAIAGKDVELTCNACFMKRHRTIVGHKFAVEACFKLLLNGTLCTCLNYGGSL